MCSKCHIHVHKCCYDFEPRLTVLSDRISEFLCDRCAQEEEGHCLVCFGVDGPMKQIGNELIHVYCGLVHNDIEVVSYYPSIVFRKSLYYDEGTALC